MLAGRARVSPLDDGVRIAELVGTLSYAADLGLGQPMDHCLRQTVIAGRLAALAGASDRDRATTFYLGLLMNTHCHADATEQATWFDDDIGFKAEGVETLGRNTAQILAFFVRRLASHGSASARARRLMTFPLRGQQLVLGFMTTHAALGARFAERIGLDPAVCVAIGQAYEQWDGKGVPAQLAGEQIGLPARLVQLASPVEVFSRRHGPQAAVTMARRHAGTQFDPALVDLFCGQPPTCSTASTRPPDWDAVLEVEPQPSRRVGGADLDAVLEAMADLADLKSPYFAGHSRGVANLADEAARLSGLPAARAHHPASGRADARPRPGRRLHRDLGQARPPHRHRPRTRPPAPVPDRPHAGPDDRALGPARSPRGTMSGSTARATRGA